MHRGCFYPHNKQLVKRGGGNYEADIGVLERGRCGGVVEVILILVVLIGLVLIFKKQLVSLVNSLMEKVTKQSNTV